MLGDDKKTNDDEKVPPPPPPRSVFGSEDGNLKKTNEDDE